MYFYVTPRSLLHVADPSSYHICLFNASNKPWRWKRNRTKSIIASLVVAKGISAAISEVLDPVWSSCVPILRTTPPSCLVMTLAKLRDGNESQSTFLQWLYLVRGRCFSLLVGYSARSPLEMLSRDQASQSPLPRKSDPLPSRGGVHTKVRGRKRIPGVLHRAGWSFLVSLRATVKSWFQINQGRCIKYTAIWSHALVTKGCIGHSVCLNPPGVRMGCTIGHQFAVGYVNLRPSCCPVS